MNKAFSFVFLFALFPLTFALGAEPQTDPEIPLEDLAHSLLLHGRLDPLKSIVSEAGFQRIEPEIAEYRSAMNDSSKLVPLVRQACSEMRGAKSGKEFAAALRRIDEKHQWLLALLRCS